MGCAAGFGLWVGSIFALMRKSYLDARIERREPAPVAVSKSVGTGVAKTIKSLPRVAIVIAGGLFGGAMVGLINFSGADFAPKNPTESVYPQQKQEAPAEPGSGTPAADPQKPAEE